MSRVPGWVGLLQKSVKKNGRDPTNKFLSLATVGEDGSPANRYVVYRGLLNQSSTVIKLITDRRSQKVNQIGSLPFSQIAWYMRQSREQYRISGIIQIITSEASDPVLSRERVETWNSLSDNARSQFFWPCPGEPLAPPVKSVTIFEQFSTLESNDTDGVGLASIPVPEQAGSDDNGSAADPQPETPTQPSEPLRPSENFCLVLIYPYYVDHLSLRFPQKRETWKTEDE